MSNEERFKDDNKPGIPQRLKIEQENHALRLRIEKYVNLNEYAGRILKASVIDDVYVSVVEAAVVLTDAEYGAVFVWLPQDETLMARAQWSLGDKLPRSIRVNAKDSIAVQALVEMEPKRFTSKERDLRLATGHLVNAVLYVPIIDGRTVLGVLYVAKVKKDESFSQADQDLLSSVASYAAIAIQGARRTQLQKRVYDTGQSLLSDRTHSTVLLDIVEGTRDLLGADIIILFEFDSERDDVLSPPTVAGTLHHPEMLHEWGVLHTDSIVLQTLETNEPFYASNVLQDWGKQEPLNEESPVANTSFFTRERIVSSAGIPLIVGDIVTGALFVNYRAATVFDDVIKQHIQIMANQAAVAIWNARLLAASERRVIELSALHKIGYEIGNDPTLRLQEILQLVYEQAATLMDVTNFYIALYDEASDLVSFGFAVEYGQLVTLGQGVWSDRCSGNGMSEYVIHSRRPLLIPHSVEEWQRVNNVDQIGVIPMSWLGVPMIIGDRVIGVIGVQSYELPNCFDEKHLDVLQIIASQTAIAIQNTRLIAQRDRRLTELRALHEVSLRITQELDPALLLQSVVRIAAELLGAPGGGVLLRKPGSRQITMEVTYNAEQMAGVAIELGQGAAGRVAETGLPMIVNDYFNWEGRNRQFDTKAYSELFNSLVQVPLIWQSEILGVLSIHDSHKDRLFSSQDLELLELFAAQAVIALQNARTFSKKLRELEALRQADVALLSTMDLDQMLGILLNQLVNFVDCECLVVRLWDEERGTLELSEARGAYPGRIPQSQKLGFGISGKAAFERVTIVTSDLHKSEEFKRSMDHTLDPEEREYLKWARSISAVPLVARDKLIGVLTAISAQPAFFKEDDIRLVEKFAGQAALALQNARLIEQSRQHAVLMVHQLNGPLQGIRGDVDHQLNYISRKYGEDERLRTLQRRIDGHFARITKEMDNFAFLVRDELIGSHKYAMNYKPLGQIIHDAAGLFTEVAKFRGLEIRIDESVHKLPFLLIDRENMLTVFTNLIDNAVKYSYHNRIIEITAEQPVGEVRITVSDFGLGVSPKDTEHIFKLYARGRLRDDRRFVQGTGIGLWVSRQIVRAHGGDLSVWSALFDHPELLSDERDVIERGFLTAFTVRLPR